MRHSADHRFDVKTIHGGGKHYASARARGGDGQCGAVADRARIVQTDYERHAERLDGVTEVRQFNGGRIDVVRVRLQQLGPIRSLVWGAYAEASDDVHQLADVVAGEMARREWRVRGARSEAEARSYYVARLRRSWGIMVAREMARFRLRRVPFIGQPHDFRPGDRVPEVVPVLGGGEGPLPTFGAAGSRARAGGVRARGAA